MTFYCASFDLEPHNTTNFSKKVTNEFVYIYLNYILVHFYTNYTILYSDIHLYTFKALHK